MGPAGANSAPTLGLVIKCVQEQNRITYRLHIWELLVSKRWSKSPERPLHVVWPSDRTHKALINSLCSFSKGLWSSLQWHKALSSAASPIGSCAPAGAAGWWLAFLVFWLFYLFNEQEMSASPSLSETMKCTWVWRAGLGEPDSWSVSREPSYTYPGRDSQGRQDTCKSAWWCSRGWIPSVFVFQGDWQWYLKRCKLWLYLVPDTAE